MTVLPSVSRKIKTAPKTPGIYLFKDGQGKVLYIGKAIALRHRLSFYRQPQKDAKTRLFLSKAREVDWVQVGSDIEAILLEMNLIKQLKPPYNSVWRDDKRPLYLVITREEFPKITTARLPQVKGDAFGPFPSPYRLRQVLKSLRRIFPFCTCKRPKFACLYADLGLCNPCPSTISSPIQKQRYQSTIRRLKLFLSGKTKQVVRELKQEMRRASLDQDFETAAARRDQIEAVTVLLAEKPRVATYLQSEVLAPYLAQTQLKALQLLLTSGPIRRIEGFDVANLGGRWATASLVVFENGRPSPDQYRRFRVRIPQRPNDPAMMRHIVTRRLHHREWPFPEVLLVDGGKPQVGAIRKLLDQAGLGIRLVGLAKREETLVIPGNAAGHRWNQLTLPPESPALTLLRAVRDEAHRFATTYHRLLRAKASLPH